MHWPENLPPKLPPITNRPNPNYLSSEERLAKVQRTAEFLHDPERSEWDSKKTVSVCPKSLSDQAYEAFQHSNWKLLTILCTSLLKMDQNNEWALQARARSYFETGRWKRYLQDVRHLIEIDSTNLEYIKGKIKAYFELGNYNRVIFHATSLLSKDSLTEDLQVWALKKRCRAYWNQEEDVLSLADAQAILAIRPNDRDLFNWGILIDTNREE